MPFLQILSNELHQQDTNYYCGAATAQMILDSINGTLMDQNTLYTSNHSHSQPGWATDAYGLAYTLNLYNNSQYGPFVVFDFVSERDQTWKIIYTIYHYKVPVGALVFGSGHWIAVKGYSTDVDPKKTNSYTLNGLYIDNPWPPSPGWNNSTLTPPPHSGNDGCGTGGNRGIASEYVTYSNWQSTYMTGFQNNGNQHFISVGDPERPKIGKIKMRPNIFYRPNELIKNTEVHEILSKGIELHELKENKLFAEALESAVPAEPLLVKRLDKVDTYYYLVPMKRDDSITSVMSMDAITGNFQGGMVVKQEMRGDVKKGMYVTDKRMILDKVLNKPIQLSDKEGILHIHEGTFSLAPIMVWKPCQESRSPYYPFHMVTVGNDTVYVGYDGQVYTQLHDLSNGG